MAELDVDVIISVHFMLILPLELLSRLSTPVLNLHPALLPAYRGPSPLAAMVVDESADRHGGVTLHAIVPAVDAGRIKGPPPSGKKRQAIGASQARKSHSLR